MPGYNQGVFIGYIGAEPKYKVVGDKDKALLKFSVGTSDWYRGQQTPTQWHDVCVWGDYADTLNGRIHTGQLVLVVYAVRNSVSQAAQGEKKRKEIQFWASSVQVLSDKKQQSSKEDEPEY